MLCPRARSLYSLACIMHQAWTISTILTNLAIYFSFVGAYIGICTFELHMSSSQYTSNGQCVPVIAMAAIAMLGHVTFKFCGRFES